MISIRRTLLLWLAGGLALALIAATVATYLRARDEANALFDVQLTQLAASVTGMPLAAPRCRAASTRTARWSSRCGIATASRSIARRAGARRRRARGPGFATVATRDGPWRVYSVARRRRTRAGGAAAVGARRTRRQPGAADHRALARRRAARRAAALVRDRARAGAARPRRRRGLPPQRRASSRRWQRPAGRAKCEPLVDALNALLGRLDAALAAQRDLRRRRCARAAHAAHRRAPAGAARRARDRARPSAPPRWRR